MPERSGLDPSGPHTARRRDAGRIVRLARQTERYSFAGSRRPANATVMQGSASLKPATGRFHNAAHEFPVHVYFEDTDLSGLIYHANYLRYMERGRSDMLRPVGIDQYDTLESGQGFYRSEEHTSELQSLMRISSAVFCLKKQTS